MKSYALVAIWLTLLNITVQSHAQQGASNPSPAPKQELHGLWQKLVVSTENPDGIEIYDGFSSFGDWIAASYKNRSGALYTQEGGLTGNQLIYNLNGPGVGSYLFDPVLTKDKMFFRFGNVENPIDGFNLLYVIKDVKPLQVYWVSPESLYYTRVEISPSGRYVAYMTSGGYHGASHGYHGDPMALWVTDTQNNEVAQVDKGDWIEGTYWWDGEKLRFLNLVKEPIPSVASIKPQSATTEGSKTHGAKPASAVKPPPATREYIESKRFAPVSGSNQMLGRQLYQESRLLLEDYYNAFFGESYTVALPKQYGTVPQFLAESVLFNSERRELLFASQISVAKEETKPDGSYYLHTFAIVALTGANKFNMLTTFTMRSFDNNPEIQLFRVGERLFVGVKSYSSTRSTYAPNSDVFFPSCTMTIYEIKNGKVEIIRKEENCFGLSQLIDGASVFVTY